MSTPVGTLLCVDHWAKGDEDRKAVLLTTYRMAGAYAAHYSSVRTALALAAFAYAYAIALPAVLPALLGGYGGSAELVQSAAAALVMILGQLLSARLLARTNRARAVAWSAQNRRDDDLLFHESSEEPGPPRFLDTETRGAWLIEPFPIFYEDLFRRLRGVRSGWTSGTGNRAHLALTAVVVAVFLWAVLT
jgi:hypothetical protein